MRISAQSLSIYANGKSPFVGLPVCDDGGRRPALFMRKHFVAAIGGGVTFVKFDHEKQVLIVRGVRSSYMLRDLSTNTTAYEVKTVLEKWAGSKRRAKARKALPANARLTTAQAEEIAKLERRAAKLHAHKPVNPCATTARERWDGSRVWMRDSVASYVLDRAKRRGLGKLFGKYFAHLSRPRGKFPWAQLELDIAALGLRLDSSNAWAKVRTRKAHRGIDIPEYLKSLPVFVSGLSHRKPWDLEPYEIAQRIESYREARGHYFETLRDLKFIQDQIQNIRALLPYREN